MSNIERIAPIHPLRRQGFRTVSVPVDIELHERLVRCAYHSRMRIRDIMTEAIQRIVDHYETTGSR